MPFNFEKTEINDLVVIIPKVFSDDRGFFLESYKYTDFESFGIKYNFKQDNHSFSQQGVLRGLHYQLPPMAQGKLVRVITGAVWDVAVDIRKNSPTFKRWFGVELTGENNKMFFIPPGFAHGFVALKDNTNLLYKCTEEYSYELDRGIIWNDPDIGIKWPLENPVLSEKDSRNPLLRDAEVYK